MHYEYSADTNQLQCIVGLSILDVLLPYPKNVSCHEQGADSLC